MHSLHLLWLIAALAGAGSAEADAQQAPQAYPLSCVYVPEGGEIDQFSQCARSDEDGTRQLDPQHLRKLMFDANGLAAINIEDGWYYFRRDGVSAPVVTLDNWAEEFVDGRAASPAGGKIGFIDPTLKLVIPRRYDGALPFERGVAPVCIGCVEDHRDEHTAYEGGAWTCIDPDGRELLPLRQLASDESARALCAPYRTSR